MQLRIDFLAEKYTGAYRSVGLSGLESITIDRSYITFYDLDTGVPYVDNSKTQIEAIQLGPQTITTEVSSNPPTELEKDDQYTLMQRLALTGGADEPAT